MNIVIDGMTHFSMFGNNVIVSKFLSYHTLHVRSEGGYTHRVCERPVHG
jgi:hypothetical protein